MPFCLFRRPTNSNRFACREPPGENSSAATGIGATVGIGADTTSRASSASQRDTAVTAAEWCITWRNAGRENATDRASRTSVPCSVVTSGLFAMRLSHVPTSPFGNHQCACTTSGATPGAPSPRSGIRRRGIRAA